METLLEYLNNSYSITRESDKMFNSIEELKSEIGENEVNDLIKEFKSKNRRCDIKYNPNEVILGNITFLHEENDGVNKAIIHRIDAVIECTSSDEASQVGEDNLNEYEAYLVPSVYRFDIELDEQ